MRAGPWPTALAVAMLLLGLGLPPDETAAWLRGGTGIPTGLVGGLWLLKALLVWHAAAIVAVARHFPSRRDDAAPALPPLPLLGLLVAGLALRLPGVGEGLWFDEIQTLLDYVRQPLGVVLTTFDTTNQHLLFSVAANLSSAVFGATTAALRLPAVLFGVASLWAAIEFGRRWLPARQAWWSAVILAVSYHHVWFSQNARGYTGLLLGTLVASGLFLDLLRDRTTPMRIWGYALAMALTLLTHVTALVVLAAHGLVWLASLRRHPAPARRAAPLIALVLAGSLAVAGYAMVIPQLLGAVDSSGTAVTGVAWQRPSWFLAEAIRGLTSGVPAGIVLVPLAGLVVLAGLASAWRRDRQVAAIMVLPLLLLAIPLVATGHNLWPRFFFFGAGFVVQWAIHGGFVVLERVVARHAGTIGNLGLAGVTTASLFLLPRAWAPKQDYRAAAAWVTANARPGDAIVATEMLDLPMNRWLGHAWPVVTDLDQLRAIEQQGMTTWVIYTFPIRLEATAPELMRHLASAYHRAKVIPGSVGGGAIVIVQREGR